MKTNKDGFNVVGFLVGVAMLGLLVAIVISLRVNHQETLKRSNEKIECQANLKRLRDNKAVWIAEMEARAKGLPATNMSGLKCPANGVYTMTLPELMPICSLHGIP